MSAIIPPPPPPCVQQEKKKFESTTETKMIDLDKCVWAKKCLELQKACYLSRVCENKAPKICQFRNIKSMLQIGPTCGFTALSMILEGTPTTEELIEEAKIKSFTNNGEIFSAQYLMEFVKKYFVDIDQNDRRSCHLHESILNCNQIRDSLLNGVCIFVPYDPDFNHSPCLRDGHKAHWAIVIGCLITQENEFYVLARHGKAKNLAVWSLKDLSDSNANLFEYAQPKGYPDLKFLLPAGGISGPLGLRERAVVITGVRQDLIKVKCEFDCDEISKNC